MHTFFNFNISGFLKDIILPPVCVLCGRLSESPLCDICNSEINFFGSDICSRCGKPFGYGPSENLMDASGFKEKFDKNITSDNICSLCKNEGYNFYMARSFSLYKGKLAELISVYKYKKYYYLKEVLAGFLERAYKFYYGIEKIDHIDTVPDHLMAEMQSTGNAALNHMQQLAQVFAEKIRIPFADNILKIKKTQRQQLLDREQRMMNQAGAFKVKDCLKVVDKNVLVIDDVFTTGSTLNQISSTLKNAGAQRIYLLTLARGA